MTIRIIISRYNENIEWSNSFTNVLIYNKGNALPNKNVINLANVGREGHTYYTYIYENYNKLDNYTIFLQGNPFDHSPHILNDITNLLNSTNLDIDFCNLCKNTFECSFDNGHGPMKSVFKYLFGDYIGNETFKFGPGAQFMVSKKNILSRPREFYLKIIKLLENNSHPMEGFVIERFHKLIFTHS